MLWSWKFMKAWEFLQWKDRSSYAAPFSWGLWGGLCSPCSGNQLLLLLSGHEWSHEICKKCKKMQKLLAHHYKVQQKPTKTSNFKAHLLRLRDLLLSMSSFQSQVRSVCHRLRWSFSAVRSLQSLNRVKEFLHIPGPSYRESQRHGCPNMSNIKKTKE